MNAETNRSFGRSDRYDWRYQVRCITLSCVVAIQMLLAPAIAQDTNNSNESTNVAEVPRGDEVIKREEENGILTLVNGSTAAGRVLAGGDGAAVRWQAGAFLDPFEFRFSAIKSIRFDGSPDEDVGEPSWSVQLVNGDLISGELLDWSWSQVNLQALGLGEFRLRPDALRTITRAGEDRQSLVQRFAGVPDLDGGTWEFENWNRDGDQIWTQVADAKLQWNSKIPSRAIVETELSWGGEADWTMVLGSEQTRPTAWRITAANGELKLVSPDDATQVRLQDLNQRQSIRFSIILDSESQRLRCYDSLGRLLGEASAGTELGQVSNVSWRNASKTLRLERFRVAQWRGPILDSLAGTATILLEDDSLVCGKIRTFDASAKRLSLGDGSSGELDSRQVRGIRMRPTASIPERPQCALFVSGGQRISGVLQSINSSSWVLDGDHLVRSVSVPSARIRSMVVFNNDTVDFDQDAPLGRAGRLEWTGGSLRGRLVSPDPEDAGGDVPSKHGLRWHPAGSRTSASLKAGASGRIVYRETIVSENDSMIAKAREMQQQRIRQQRRGLNFGELFLRRVDSAGATEIERDAHTLHTRTGDVIPCRIESIDETGVRLSTVRSEDQWVPHRQIKAIELAANTPPPNLADAKRQRLLTIPRLQKSSPPTHLLCSYNGDFLRCRVVEMDAHRVLVDVRGKPMELPRERIAQMIWFHPETQRPMGAPLEDSDRSLEEMTQVLKRDGKRVTFQSLKMESSFIAGQSPVVGPCRFNLNDIDQVIFGDRIRSEVADLAYNLWTLTPATEPLVMQASGQASGQASQTTSPLIGTEAPELVLQRLDGGEFRLSRSRDKVVVLDFWASWCAPCRVSMPKVEALIADQDPDQVLLVSVNMEESLERAAGFVERQQLNSSVVLDVDGVAASKFKVSSIPHWVVIDRAGKIVAVHSGGGQESLERLEAAIADASVNGVAIDVSVDRP